MGNYNTRIKQSPTYQLSPVEQELIIIVENALCVAQETKVKFNLEIQVGPSIPLITIGVFKTTPNNKGYGVFNINEVLGSYVSSDNLCTENSSFKGNGSVYVDQFDLHLIDKFSMNKNLLRYAKILASTEFLDTNSSSPTYNEIVETQQELAGWLNIFNGYVKLTDVLSWGNAQTTAALGFGFDMTDFLISSGSQKEFLTNSPNTQYTNSGDYGTLAFIKKHIEYTNRSSTEIDAPNKIAFEYHELYNGTGTPLGTEYLDITAANGGYDLNTFNTDQKILYVGAFPANIRAWSALFRGHLTARTMESYTVYGVDDLGAICTEKKIFNINCPTLKGYVPIRLAWINQWGTWDYYTFTQKSIKTINTSGTTYSQLPGNWNDSAYYPSGYKGGKKSFRVNAVEKIKMNSDFVTETNSEWFEELVNSPEIYILKEWESPTTVGAIQIGFRQTLLNQYSTPVRLTSTSFTKKTVANDKLIQYTFEVEKSKTSRTQSI